VAALAKHVHIAWAFVPEALITPVVNLKTAGGVADFALRMDVEDEGSKGNPVVRGEIDVLVPLLPGPTDFLPPIPLFLPRSIARAACSKKVRRFLCLPTGMLTVRTDEASMA
jgi:hypothetical protein